jgi:hypothetical protein
VQIRGQGREEEHAQAEDDPGEMAQKLEARGLQLRHFVRTAQGADLREVMRHRLAGGGERDAGEEDQAQRGVEIAELAPGKMPAHERLKKVIAERRDKIRDGEYHPVGKPRGRGRFVASRTGHGKEVALHVIRFRTTQERTNHAIFNSISDPEGLSKEQFVRLGPPPQSRRDACRW